MSNYCDHGYHPQRSGDGDGINGSCAVCEDIAELKAQLSAATARASELEKQVARFKARRFPVLEGGMSVPWEALVPHEPQAKANHGQSLERLAERGGLGWSEMLAVLEGKGLKAVREVTDKDAKSRVLALVTRRDAELSALGERVARAELQLKALDLLCGLVSEEDGTVVFRVLEGGQRHCQARLVPARGDNAGRAALDLATKLGLLQPKP